MSEIPIKKHSEEELAALRARGAMQAYNSSILTDYNKKLASKPLVGLGYLLTVIPLAWALIKRYSGYRGYEISDFYIMTIPLILALSIAFWIAIKRALSRHNSAFIFIISLFCSFPAIYAVNSDDVLKYDLLALVGKDPTLSKVDPFKSDLNQKGRTPMTEEERDLLEEKLDKMHQQKR